MIAGWKKKTPISYTPGVPELVRLGHPFWNLGFFMELVIRDETFLTNFTIHKYAQSL